MIYCLHLLFCPQDQSCMFVDNIMDSSNRKINCMKNILFLNTFISMSSTRQLTYTVSVFNFSLTGPLDAPTTSHTPWVWVRDVEPLTEHTVGVPLQDLPGQHTKHAGLGSLHCIRLRRLEGEENGCCWHYLICTQCKPLYIASILSLPCLCTFSIWQAIKNKVWNQKQGIRPTWFDIYFMLLWRQVCHYIKLLTWLQKKVCHGRRSWQCSTIGEGIDSWFILAQYLTSGTLQYTLLVVQYMLGIEKSKVMELECAYCVP